jgi:hypothetical protein
MSIPLVGAACFGLVVGWVTYRALRRREGAAALSDISAVIAAVGGAGIMALFDRVDLFGAYSIGLAIGFALYFIIGLKVYGKDAAGPWMG